MMEGSILLRRMPSLADVAEKARKDQDIALGDVKHLRKILNHKP